jgi:hypothetical protein
MSNTETYLVTATHPHPDYCFERTPVQVSLIHGETYYFATHPKLGCGKNYATADAAIRGLFLDHACRVTKVELDRTVQLEAAVEALSLKQLREMLRDVIENMIERHDVGEISRFVTSQLGGDDLEVVRSYGGRR